MPDKEYIKSITPMPELLNRYGVDVKRGRCRGFCHGGKDLNMAVYRDACHCFVCGKSFDCFEVVQFFESCDFKESIKILTGGKEIDRETESKEIAKRRADAVRRARRDEQVKILAAEHRQLLRDIEEYKPKTPYDFVSEHYVNALNRINQVKLELSELIGVIWI